jgi:hypothetical protein
VNPLTKGRKSTQIGQDDDLRQTRPHRYWTQAELTLLRQVYPAMPWRALERAFAPHPKGMIKRKASLLKIKRRRRWQVIADAYIPVIFVP